MAIGACAHRSISIGSANCMALLAASSDRRVSFWLGKRVRRPSDAARLVSLSETDLFWRQSLCSVHRRPAGDCMATAQVFLVNGLVTRSAVPGREVLADHEAVMVHLLLSSRGLMAIEAVHALLRM